MNSTLKHRCLEIRAWHTTGILPEGELRKLAKDIRDRYHGSFDMGQALQMAENETAREAMAIVINHTIPNRVSVAKSIAFASRQTNDCAKDADDFWRNTSVESRARFYEMADAVIKEIAQ